MSEHLTEKQVGHYMDGSLAPAELPAVDDHLSGCAECRKKAMRASGLSASGVRGTLMSTADLDHLDHEQIEGYVDGILGAVDREIVEGHLEFCRTCAEEVAELRSFRDTLAIGPEKVYAPAAEAGIFQRTDARTSFRVSTPWKRYRFASGFAMAAAVLIAAVVLFHIGKHRVQAPTSPGVQVAKEMPASSDDMTPPFTTPSTPVPPPASPAPSTMPVEKTAPPKSTRSVEPPKSTPSTVAPTMSYRSESPAKLPSNVTASTQFSPVQVENVPSVAAKIAPAAVPGPLPRPDNMLPASAAPPLAPMSSSATSGGLSTASNGTVGYYAAPVTAESTAAASIDGSPGVTHIYRLPVPNSDNVNLQQLTVNAPPLPDSVRQALSTGHIGLDTPEIRELTGGTAAMFENKSGTVIDNIGSLETSFMATSPVSTAVLSDRPSFSWAASKEASAYQVSITDAFGGDVEDSPIVSTTSWMAVKPLPRGRLLRWQVKAMRNGTVFDTAPAGGARFRVVDADVAAKIVDAQKTFAGQPAALGVIYAQARMFDDAERELAKANQAEPGNAVVGKLLSEVRSVRRVP